MTTFKIFKVVNNTSPFGEDSPPICCFKDKKKAYDFIAKSNNAYLLVKDALAIQIGDAFYLLAQEKPIHVLE